MILRQPAEKTACFSGHRPQRLPWGFDEDDMRHALLLSRMDMAIDAAIEDGITHFLCGGALGTDTWAAQSVLAKKLETGGVTLEIIIPFLGQDKHWPARERERYRELLLSADGFIVLEPKYTRSCMMSRNRYMVENSSRLIAVYDGEPAGGTWQTIKMALERGLSLDIIDARVIE
ncbi:MAG: DUF1273 domain-containing protein [Oscillospiraceae bacterium]|nr:DUF1273 domain-containing protein [Oscillospiraceae bacterium]